ncbi:MAG: sensor histidine kinase [Saprospiraceae bacterium]
MESNRELDIFLVLFVGMAGFLLLAGAVVLFFMFYQKRMLRQQLKLSEMESKHQEQLVISNLRQVEAERQRIAKDLHDEVGGIFSTLRMKISSIKPEQFSSDIQETQRVIDSGINSVRRISHDLMPPGLELFGLAASLEDLCEKNNADGLLQVVYGGPDTLNCPANMIRDLAIYRIVQELLNNTIKHAQASEVGVYLNESPKHISLTYKDNGIGFDSEKLDKIRGLGLANLQSRANQLGAQLEWTHPPKGVCVHLTVPII